MTARQPGHGTASRRHLTPVASRARATADGSRVAASRSGSPSGALAAATNPAVPAKDRRAVLPAARGPLSAAVLAALTGDETDRAALGAAVREHGPREATTVSPAQSPAAPGGPAQSSAAPGGPAQSSAAPGGPAHSSAAPGDGAVLTDPDLQLALLLLQEQHYRGHDGVPDDLEWHPALVAARLRLERAVEQALRAATDLAVRRAAALAREGGTPTAENVARALADLGARDDGPSVARHLDREGTPTQVREFAVHRSLYQLKEADPHSWAIPRLAGRAKAALVEVQVDEYGGGRPQRMHSTLFAHVLRGLDLDDRYGGYVDALPALTMATVTAMSTFGLQRRLRGAIAGHLAAFEMTSSLPNRRYGNALRRLGAPAPTLWFFDEHVEADAVHEQIAARDLAGGLVEAEPHLLDDVLFGAAACLHLDALWARHVLSAWEQGRTSLDAGVVTVRGQGLDQPLRPAARRRDPA